VDDEGWKLTGAEVVKDFLLSGAWDRWRTFNAGKFPGKMGAADVDSEGKEDGIDAEDGSDEDDER